MTFSVCFHMFFSFLSVRPLTVVLFKERMTNIISKFLHKRLPMRKYNQSEIGDNTTVTWAGELDLFTSHVKPYITRRDDFLVAWSSFPLHVLKTVNFYGPSRGNEACSSLSDSWQIEKEK